MDGAGDGRFLVAILEEEGVVVTEEEKEAIIQLVESVLQEEGGGGEVSILLTHDHRMQKLNRRYRYQDAPTDVLSFPQQLPDFLGDIAISLEMAQRKAQEENIRPLTALLILVLHGLLHLLGFDHEKDARAQEMEEREAQYRQRFNLR